jgi:phospholipase C
MYMKYEWIGLSIKKSATIIALCAFILCMEIAQAYGAKANTNAATPIKHLVIIFQENVSFDHYFATYPNATNPPGEPAFKLSSDTPSVNGLANPLLINNPNSANPFRLDHSEAATCDQDHDYKAEQQAFHAGLMNKFVEFTGSTDSGCNPKQVMGYFDGNTVTALWNYAQNFAMSDNFYGTTFGPSALGALNLISGQTHGAIGSCILEPPSAGCVATSNTLSTKSGIDVVQGTVIGDAQPKFDDCSTRETVVMTGKNIGDLLNTRGITWGWFQGGFKPTGKNNGKAICGAAHLGSNGKIKGDYIPHHEPFQYYHSTANLHHLSPSSVAMIGLTDQANHQYDLSDFWAAANAGNLPSVSFLKAPGFQDGHAGYSDPLAEQTFLVNTINQLQQLSEWKNMAIIIAYDDSDGWYDHVMPPIVNQSSTTDDALTGPGSCGVAAAGAYQGRCSYGPRLPLIIISPFAKVNFVDHTLTDQTSILRFIEDNWALGRIGDQSFDEKAGSLLNMFDFGHGKPSHRLILDPVTGQLPH